MKSRAAVAFGPGQPLKIVEIDVAPPKKGEVLVKITHTGVCHTDAFTLSGDDPEGVFPELLHDPPSQSGSHAFRPPRLRARRAETRRPCPRRKSMV